MYKRVFKLLATPRTTPKYALFYLCLCLYMLCCFVVVYIAISLNYTT